MPSVDIDEMGESAKRCRRRIVDMVYKAQSVDPTLISDLLQRSLYDI